MSTQIQMNIDTLILENVEHDGRLFDITGTGTWSINIKNLHLKNVKNILVCYYEDTGRIIPKCSSPSIRVCTSNLSTHDFDIYTQFYNHGDSFCFYRESKEWQSQTDASIHHLEESTQQTIQKLYFLLF